MTNQITQKERIAGHAITLGEGYATFIVMNGIGPLSQAIVYIDSIYRGITNDDGKLISSVLGYNVGKSHTYIVVRPGHNSSTGRILIISGLAIVQPVTLTKATPGKGSIQVYVDCYGRPCEGADIIYEGIKIGITDSDGSYIIDGLDPAKEITITIRKEGFEETRIHTHVSDRIVIDAKIVHLIPLGINTLAVFQTIDKDGTPISDVNIFIDDELYGITDNNGQLIVTNLTNQYVHDYIMSKSGYRTISGKIDLTTGIRFIPDIMSRYQG